ncbi:MAG: YceI family protein [Eudoraea sp.]|nr:YceI family protein [Eudoraea sp.]
MLYRIIYIVLFACSPIISNAQSGLVLQEISFIFEYKGVSGTIGDFHSTSEVNLEDLEDSYFEGSVSVSSLKTGNFLRDWALKGRKYFNEDEFPRIEFRSTTVIRKDEGFLVEGQLSMKGNTTPLQIDFIRTEKGLTGKAVLYTSDYGISIKKDREENKVHIHLEFGLE